MVGRLTTSRAAALILAGAIAACGAESTDNLAAVGAFLDLHASGKAAAATQFFTTDARITGPEHDPIVGIDAIAERMAWDSVLSARYRVVRTEPVGEAVYLRGLTREGDDLDLLGIDVLHHGRGSRATFRGGRILTLELSPLAEESAQRLDEALSAFGPWARHEYAERWERVRPGGRFDYRARRAPDLLSLLREWATSER